MPIRACFPAINELISAEEAANRDRRDPTIGSSSEPATTTETKSVLQSGQTTLGAMFLRVAIVCVCLCPISYGSITAGGLLLLMMSPAILYPVDRLSWLMVFANFVLAGSVYVRGL